MGTEFTIDNLIDELNYTKAWKITHWLGKEDVVRVTRTLYEKRIPSKSHAKEYTVTIGVPNYREREMVRRNKNFIESSGHWVQFPPKRKGKK